MFASGTLVGQNSGNGGKETGLRTSPQKSTFSLFDPSRFHMSQGYSLSYLSTGSQGRMIGMYLNQIDYDLAKSLHVSFAVAWLHQPQGLLGVSNRPTDNRLLPSFQLVWRPSRSFQLLFGYERRYWPSPLDYGRRYHGYGGIWLRDDDQSDSGVLGDEDPFVR